MKKTSAMAAMLVVSILMIFCVPFVLLRFVFVAAAAFFCYGLSSQMLESVKDGREKEILRIEQLLQSGQDQFKSSLDEIVGQMTDREEKMSRLLNDMSVQNTEQTEHCVQVIEELLKSGEERLGRLSENGEKMMGRLADNGEKMLGRLSENGEEMMGRLAENSEEMMGRLADNGKQMTERMVSDNQQTLERLSDSGEKLLERLAGNSEDMMGRISNSGKEMMTQLMNICGETTKQLSENAERVTLALEKEEGYCASVEEQVRVIKTVMEINIKKLTDLTDNHYDKMNELFEDQNDNIEESLESLKKGQLQLLRENCDRMEKQIDELRKNIWEGLQPVLAQNEALLDYIQKVQKEWTDLDREELRFLDRVWRER